MARGVDERKHLQLILEDAEYQVLKLALVVEANRLNRNMTIKEFIEQAVQERCLSILNVSSLMEAVQLIDTTFGGTKE
jgi:hypothetical protein